MVAHSVLTSNQLLTDAISLHSIAVVLGLEKSTDEALV